MAATLAKGGVTVGVIVHIAVGDGGVGNMPRPVISAGEDTRESPTCDFQILQRQRYIRGVSGKRKRGEARRDDIVTCDGLVNVRCTVVTYNSCVGVGRAADFQIR